MHKTEFKLNNTQNFNLIYFKFAAVQNERDRIVNHKRVVIPANISSPSLCVNSLYETELRTRQVTYTSYLFQ